MNFHFLKILQKLKKPPIFYIKVSVLLVLVFFIYEFLTAVPDQPAKTIGLVPPQQLSIIQELSKYLLASVSGSNIILISGANELDASRKIIADIYSKVSSQDGVYITIPNGNYVRATFERALSNANDITLYAKGNGTVEVYKKDSTDKIMSFDIAGENTYKKLLTNMSGTSDSFDLKSVGDISYDFITDPFGAATITVDSATSITATGATITGNVTDTGGDNPTIYISYGTTDGGYGGGSYWDHYARPPTSPAQPQGVGAFSLTITGLSDSTKYYFIVRAENANGAVMASASPNNYFTTLAGSASDSVVVSVIVDKEVLISAPANLTLTGTILGVTGGTQLGTVTWQVISSSQAGFAMTLKAGAAPALATGSYRFQDYTTGTTSFAWNAPAAGTTSFAFSVGADSAASAVAAFKNGGAACGAGASNSTNNCWQGFNGTTAIPVVNTIGFSAGSVSESFALKASFTPQAGYAIPADIYTATVTATATVN